MLTTEPEAEATAEFSPQEREAYLRAFLVGRGYDPDDIELYLDRLARLEGRKREYDD